MNYLPRDIRQIKLANGDEILTEVTGEDQNELLICNPLKVYKEKLSMGGIAKEINMFSRWMGFAENDEFILQKYHIIAEAIVNDMVAGHYNRMINNDEHDIEDTEGDDDYTSMLDDIDTDVVH